MDFAIDIYSQRKIVSEERAIELAAVAGFSYINYDIDGIEDEADFIASPKEYGKRIRACFDKYGVRCALSHAPYFMRYGQPFSESERQYMEIVRAFECAHELGCDTMVVHAITVPDSEDFEEYNLGFYRSLIPYAEKYNLKIAIENLYISKDDVIVGGKFETPEKMLSFMDKLPREHFTTCLDLGHAFLTGCDPAEFILKLGNRLGHVHLHDNMGKKDDHTLPGVGAIDWKRVKDALCTIGFNGVLSYELCKYLSDFKENELKEVLKNVLEKGRELLC